MTQIKTYNALTGAELLKVAFTQAFDRFKEHSLFREHLTYHNPIIRFTIEVSAFDNSEGYDRAITFQTGYRFQEQVAIPTSPPPPEAREIREEVVLEPTGEFKYPDKVRADMGLPIPTPSPTPEGIVDIPTSYQKPPSAPPPMRGRASQPPSASKGGSG